ncbi:MAG: hypothetical protein ACTSUR_01465 [Candidatus Heimdallarchaeaceae archaeon]
MVYNPYDNESSKDDSRKAKLRDQAQQQFIAQLQQRIANQSNTIDNLNEEIQKLNAIILKKDQELEAYSKKVAEERLYFEEDKKARDSRERELQKKIQKLEIEIKKLQEENSYQPVEESTSSHQPTSDEQQDPHLSPIEVNEFIERLLAYYKRPTKDEFVDSLQGLIAFCSEKGSIDQQILGVLLNSNLPMTLEKITESLNTDSAQVNRALFRLMQKELIKKIGTGYVLVSSEFAERADVSQDWGSLPPNQIFENLMSIAYAGGSSEELIEVFTRARDALMETAVLGTMKIHDISQTIEKIKRQTINTPDLIEKIKSWKESL